MKYIITNLFLFILLLYCISLKAQNNFTSDPSGGEYIYEKNDEEHPCISALEYQLLEQEISRNNSLLNISPATQHRISTTLFNWPIKAAANLADCDYYFIGAYVDQDTSSGNIKDFNCLTNTYNGHRGTDIAPWPYSFYKMDNNQIEVIAAAAGTIVARSDGNFDRNCTSNNLTANYIIIQHEDGSEALYWHMKKNSVTAKTVGQTVATGEYLGIVGSSGSSSGPHLHFEVWSGTTSATRKDPFSGTCNYLNTNSWWTAQKPHTNPSILKVSVNTTDLVLPGCPGTETSNESSSFTIPFQGAGLPAGFAKFYIFLREIPVAGTIDIKILNPNGTTFNSWTLNITTFYKVSYYGWSKLLPTIAGTYKFQATYNGVTCSKNFDIVTNSATATITASGPTTFCQGDSVTLTANAGSSYLWNNGATTRSITVKANGSFSVTVTNASGNYATSATTTVTVNALPAASITASGNTTFCQGDSVILTASAGSSYLWNNGSITRSITIKTNGSFLVKVTNANNCSATSAVTTTTVRTPQNNLGITLRNDTLFSPYAAPAKWYLSSNPNSIDNKLFHVCLASGNYYVTGRDANGCTATSATLFANCSITAVSSKTHLSLFEIYPNPTSDFLNIVGDGIENGNYTLTIRNVIGQIISKEDVLISNNRLMKIISLSTLENDIYFLSIESEDNIIIQKILKQY